MKRLGDGRRMSAVGSRGTGTKRRRLGHQSRFTDTLSHKYLGPSEDIVKEKKTRQIGLQNRKKKVIPIPNTSDTYQTPSGGRVA